MEMEEPKPNLESRDAPGIPTVSALLPDGRIVEMVYDAAERRTALVVGTGDDWRQEPTIEVAPGERLVPYGARNNLVRHGIVLFPSVPAEYGSEQDLVREVRAYLHRYLDVGPSFEQIASYYVLFTWLYDRFNELPYLRVRGDAGSGKTRFLLTVGSLCYKPIFASGASTVSPIFRLLDTFRGTLVVDESDWRHTDERAEIVKILNNGNGKGFPVLRSEPAGAKGEFNPRAYAVFGPKLVATRGFFEDQALESRCLTEDMGERSLRDDVPINLPDCAADEALALRNKLLLFRLRTLDRCRPDPALVDRTIEPRLNQIFVPLLSIVTDDAVRRDLKALALRHQRDLVSDRGMSVEAQVVEVLCDLVLADERARPSVKEITAKFIDRYGDDYERKVTTKWIGGILRKRLGLKPRRVHGTFVIAVEEVPKLSRLLVKYGIESQSLRLESTPP